MRWPERLSERSFDRHEHRMAGSGGRYRSGAVPVPRRDDRGRQIRVARHISGRAARQVGGSAVPCGAQNSSSPPAQLDLFVRRSFGSAVSQPKRSRACYHRPNHNRIAEGTDGTGRPSMYWICAGRPAPMYPTGRPTRGRFALAAMFAGTFRFPAFDISRREVSPDEQVAICPFPGRVSHGWLFGSGRC